MTRRFKAIISVSLLIALNSYTLFAMGATIGVRGGINRNTAYGYDGAYSSPAIGFNAAACFGLDLNKVFSLQPEVIYSTKGAKHLWTNVYAQDFYDFSVSYLQVALLPKIRIPLKGLVVPYVSIGPSLAFLLNISDAKSTKERDMQLPERLEPLDYTFIIGPGCLFRMGPVALTIDARADIGQQYILKEEIGGQGGSVDAGLPHEVNTQSLCLSAGIAWLLGSSRK